MEIVPYLVGNRGEGILSPDSDGEIPGRSSNHHREPTSDFKPTRVTGQTRDGRLTTAATPARTPEARSESTPQKSSLAPDEDGHDGSGGDGNFVSTSSAGMRPVSAYLLSWKVAEEEQGHETPIQEKPRRQSGDDEAMLEATDGHCGFWTPPISIPGQERSLPSPLDRAQEQGGLDGCCIHLIAREIPEADVGATNQSMESRKGGISSPRSFSLQLTPTEDNPSPASHLREPKGTNIDGGFPLEGVPSEFVSLWREDLMKLGLIGRDLNEPVTAPRSVNEMMARLIEGSRGLPSSGYKRVWNLDGNDLFEFEPVDEGDLDMATASAAGEEYMDCESPDVQPNDHISESRAGPLSTEQLVAILPKRQRLEIFP